MPADTPRHRRCTRGAPRLAICQAQRPRHHTYLLHFISSSPPEHDILATGEPLRSQGSTFFHLAVDFAWAFAQIGPCAVFPTAAGRQLARAMVVASPTMSARTAAATPLLAIRPRPLLSGGL
jgi:hypothetical protein